MKIKWQMKWLFMLLPTLLVIAAQCSPQGWNVNLTIPPSPEESAVQPLPTERPTLSTAVITAAFGDVNIRSGPSTTYPILGVLQLGQKAEVTGVSPDNGWWQIKFTGTENGLGWLARQFVTGETISDVPIVQPEILSPVFIWPTNDPVVNATTNVNVRSGPDIAYPVIGILALGQSASLTGISPDGFWWQIVVGDLAEERGWVAAQFVVAQNIADVPVVQPPAVPTAPTPVVITAWQGEYFNNQTLSGTPALVRDDADLDFDWGEGGPAGSINADDFSVRWSRNLFLPADTYRFYLYTDDGARLWIDDNLVLDQWHEFAPTTYVVDIGLTEGLHSLKLEYYEHGGEAIAQLRWERLETYTAWKGEYFNNPNLTGAPALVRNDVAVLFGWGPDAPGVGVAADNFSVRWTRNVNFSAGIYRFQVLVDDGVRLWVDGALLIDQWRSGDPKTYEADIYLTDGAHHIRLEYFDFRFDAQVQLRWEEVKSFTQWQAAYFANRHLDDDPILTRSESKIDHKWGSGSPAGVPADKFSVRWRREVDFEPGTYRFQARADDGVRVWLDEELLIDAWQDGRFRLSETERQVSAGKHTVRVEYYEHTSDAAIQFDWHKTG